MLLENTPLSHITLPIVTQFDFVIELQKICKYQATFWPLFRVDIRPNIRPNIRSGSAEYSVSADTDFTPIGRSLNHTSLTHKLIEVQFHE